MKAHSCSKEGESVWCLNQSFSLSGSDRNFLGERREEREERDRRERRGVKGRVREG